MTEHCAIHADYVGIKTLSGRKVVQITCEVALERLEEVISLLGSPNPSTGKPVGIALLHDVEVDVKREMANKAVEKNEGRKFHEMPLSQQAALLCRDHRFQKETSTFTEEGAIAWLKGTLHIKSRSELDDLYNANARSNFINIRDSYRAKVESYPEQRG